MNAPDGKPEKPELVQAEQAAEERQPEPGWREEFRVIVEEHRRLRVLQMLAEFRNSRLDIGVLESGLLRSGQAAEPGSVASAADWLAAQGLVESAGESPRLLRLTERGLAVAEGRSRADGVAWG